MLSAAILVLVGVAAQSTETELNDWLWDRDTPICALQQVTPPGFIVEISRTPGNDETEIEITNPSQPKMRSGSFRRGALRLDPGGEFIVQGSVGLNKMKVLAAYAVTQDAGFNRAFRTASSIEIVDQGGSVSRADLRSTGDAADALESCEDQKLRGWGIDPANWRGLKSHPTPLQPVRERFRDLDYPPAALAKGIEADAVIRLDVSAGGRVSNCAGLEAPYKDFVDAACKVLRGARFQPAMDSAGNAVPAPFVVDVRFRVDG
jgi:TonB family protein